MAQLLIDSWRGDCADVDAASAFADVRSLDDCDAVNAALAAAADALGGLAGYKLGWKGSFAERAALWAPLFNIGVMRSGARVSLREHKIFCAEAEFGFVLACRLEPRADKAYTAEEVWSAVDHVELCVELCGLRQHASSERLHYVADALCGACVVRGPSIGGPADDLDFAALASVDVRMHVAGVEISSGTAVNNPLDSPLASLTFLVNDLCVRLGRPLEAGALVIAGHCCQAAFAGRPRPPFVTTLPEAEFASGDTVRAVFEGLGECGVTLLD
tara:strand:- start:73 stop:891 length:819 start_codon:yes stop_codon:yes gene_type:complete